MNINPNEKLAELNTAMTGFIEKERKQISDMQRQLDAIDTKSQMQHSNYGADPVQNIVRALQDDSDFQSLARNGKGRSVVEVKDLLGIEAKAAITSTGIVTPSLLTGIGSTGRQALRLRQVIPNYQTDGASVFYVREAAFTNSASPQEEALAKAESAFTFTGVTTAVKTIATWTSASVQVLQDAVSLQRHIEGSLIWAIERKLELEMISGDGTGEHLSGLVTNATAFTTSLLGSGVWNKADVIRRAIQQQEAVGYDVNVIVLNPADWADIELAKTTTYEYVAGNAFQVLPRVLWGKQVVVTDQITSGTFLCGDSNAASLRVRMDSTIDLSDSHSDYFTKNLIAIRAELRAALCIERPAAWLYGSLTTSPA